MRSGENQVNTLIYAMGDQANDIFLSFELTTEEENDYNLVKSKFHNHFIMKRNALFERAKFNSRTQREGESSQICMALQFWCVERRIDPRTHIRGTTKSRPLGKATN